MKLWQAITAAALVWAAVFLPGLGTQEIKGDEGRGILPGKNMLMHGDWAVPHIGGKVYSRNPPLMNWLAAASFKFTGTQSEWAARLPSVAAVLAMTLCMVAAGSGWMRGAGVAFMAAVFAMTNLAILEKGRLAELEPLYVGLTCIAFALWSKFFMEERSPWLTWTLPWVFL
ncbi:MAG: phospholipid carrier-dependent glycosyltransferase, partial [Verrucomicrobiales bacterium]|nr:phospholipid carrier-dependent glycosyltransferase [Verrucomicrobiales bacterium]